MIDSSRTGLIPSRPERSSTDRAGELTSRQESSLAARPSRNGIEPSHISLPIDVNVFAGAGGLALGLKAACFSPALLVERDGPSCDTLRHNCSSQSPTLDAMVKQSGVEQIDWREVRGDVRLLAGGVPCQPFSLGGKHFAQHDERNLFPEMFRAVRAVNPKVVLIENVRGLLRSSFQPYFEYVLRQMECPSIAPKKSELWQQHNDRIRRHQCGLGYEPEYSVMWRLLDAADYGVPQNRYRVFIVATRAHLPSYRFPLPTHSRAALIRSQRSGEYWERHAVPLRLRRDRVNSAQIEDDALKPWVTIRDAVHSLPVAAANDREGSMNHWAIPGARAYAGHAGSSLDWPAKTIKAGVHGVPGGENTVVGDDGRIRYLTLRELARLQTFPDEHIFRGARIHVTRQIGNAVPCDLASAVARPLLDLIRAKPIHGVVP